MSRNLDIKLRCCCILISKFEGERKGDLVKHILPCATRIVTPTCYSAGLESDLQGHSQCRGGCCSSTGAHARESANDCAGSMPPPRQRDIHLSPVTYACRWRSAGSKQGWDWVGGAGCQTCSGSPACISAGWGLSGPRKLLSWPEEGAACSGRNVIRRLGKPPGSLHISHTP
jgi:hypothetical protein